MFVSTFFIFHLLLNPVLKEILKFVKYSYKIIRYDTCTGNLICSIDYHKNFCEVIKRNIIECTQPLYIFLNQNYLPTLSIHTTTNIYRTSKSLKAAPLHEKKFCYILYFFSLTTSLTFLYSAYCKPTFIHFCQVCKNLIAVNISCRGPVFATQL